MLAEGLVLEKNQGDWTPLELFLAGVRSWNAGMTHRFDFHFVQAESLRLSSPACGSI
jgi:hypothetical protein